MSLEAVNFNSSSGFVVRDKDGTMVALPFCAVEEKSDVPPFLEDRSMDEWVFWPDRFEVHWLRLDLKRGKLSYLSKMPSAAKYGGTTVFWLNRVYVLGGECYANPGCRCRNYADYTHPHPYVFYCDLDGPYPVWSEAAWMNSPRVSPAAVATKGKIYVFGDLWNCKFAAEVYDISQDKWESLEARPNRDIVKHPDEVSFPVLLDSSGCRILVHFYKDGCLCAYNVDKDEWECLDEQFGDEWSASTVIVDQVIYSLCDLYCEIGGAFLRAYDVVAKKRLNVKRLSNFPGPRMRPCTTKMFYLGNCQWCLLWITWSNQLRYIQFRTQKIDGEIDVFEIPVDYTDIEFPPQYARLPCLFPSNLENTQMDVAGNRLLTTSKDVIAMPEINDNGKGKQLAKIMEEEGADWMDAATGYMFNFINDIVAEYVQVGCPMEFQTPQLNEGLSHSKLRMMGTEGSQIKGTKEDV